MPDPVKKKGRLSADKLKKAYKKRKKPKVALYKIKTPPKSFKKKAPIKKRKLSSSARRKRTKK